MGHLIGQYFVLFINALLLFILLASIFVEFDSSNFRQLGVAILDLLDSTSTVLELKVRRKYLALDIGLQALGLV